MGCLLSATRNADADSIQGGELVVFFPGVRLPLQTPNFSASLAGVSPHVIDQLSASRGLVISVALALEEEAETLSSSSSHKRRSASQYTGGFDVADGQQALEDYLLLLLELAKEDSKQRIDSVPFAWKNQEDTQLETSISDWYYEVLSVLHAMAVLNLYQANVLLAPNGSQTTSSQAERGKQAVDIFLKVSGVLDYAIKCIIPKFSQLSRVKLPIDLREGVLHALSMQALGQGVEVQLGLAIANMKATLAVKRRLACEQLKYLQKAHESLQTVDVGGLWGGKHRLFINWKLAEAKAAAFYFHGLILDEGNEAGTPAKALLCLKTANGLLNESRNLSQNFSSAPPMTRPSPAWGAMKFLSERIPREFSSKARSYRDAVRGEKLPRQVPELPDFPVSLHPEDFKLPGL